jgi:hypothetical protein
MTSHIHIHWSEASAAIKRDLRIVADAEDEGRITIYPVNPDSGNKDCRYFEVRDAWGRLLEEINR